MMTKRVFIISKLPTWMAQHSRESYADEILKPASYGATAFELGVAYAGEHGPIAADLDELNEPHDTEPPKSTA